MSHSTRLIIYEQNEDVLRTNVFQLTTKRIKQEAFTLKNCEFQLKFLDNDFIYKSQHTFDTSTRHIEAIFDEIFQHVKFYHGKSASHVLFTIYGKGLNQS